MVSLVPTSVEEEAEIADIRYLGCRDSDEGDWRIDTECKSDVATFLLAYFYSRFPQTGFK